MQRGGLKSCQSNKVLTHPHCQRDLIRQVKTPVRVKYECAEVLKMYPVSGQIITVKKPMIVRGSMNHFECQCSNSVQYHLKSGTFFYRQK